MKKIIYALLIFISLSISVSCCKELYNPSHPRNQLINHINKSTVALVTSDEFGDYNAYCTAFWISETHLLTARHCIEDDNGEPQFKTIFTYTTFNEFDINIIPNEPINNVYSATVVAESSNQDLAVLKTISDINHDILEISPNPIPIGTDVYIVGHTIGLQYSLIKGIVSQVRKFNIPMMDKKMKTLQISSFAWMGNSGGAAVNVDGQVIGVTSFLLKQAPGLTFFIHRDEVVTFLNKNNIKYYQ